MDRTGEQLVGAELHSRLLLALFAGADFSPLSSSSSSSSSGATGRRPRPMPSLAWARLYALVTGVRPFLSVLTFSPFLGRYMRFFKLIFSMILHQNVF
jgi:hypothetical protein